MQQVINPNSERRRILHIPRRFSLDEWGGTEAVISNLCKAQLNMGYSPEIHTSMALAPQKHETWNGVPIHRYAYCYPFLGLSTEQKHSLDKKGGESAVLATVSLFA